MLKVDTESSVPFYLLIYSFVYHTHTYTHVCRVSPPLSSWKLLFRGFDVFLCLMSSLSVTKLSLITPLCRLKKKKRFVLKRGWKRARVGTGKVSGQMGGTSDQTAWGRCHFRQVASQMVTDVFNHDQDYMCLHLLHWEDISPPLCLGRDNPKAMKSDGNLHRTSACRSVGDIDV